LSDYQKWAHTKDQSPSLCKTYLIPNSILIDFGYADFLDTYLDIAFIGTWQDVYKGVAARLQNQGYYVLISNPASSSQIKAHLTLDGLYSYVFVGHGAGFGAINGFDPYQSPPVEPGRYTKYGIFALNLYGCDTAQTVGGTHHLPNGWEKNVATVGFFTGFTDEVDGFNPTQSMVSIPGTNQQ